jgi:phosphoglycerate dehydrogenase-like enzyme
MATIAVLDDYQNVSQKMADWSGLAAQHSIKVFTTPFASQAEAAAAVAPYEIVCIMRERTLFDAAMLAKLPNLKLLVTTGHRNAAIDVAAANARGVVVSGTDAPGIATAELAMGLILGLSRHLAFEAQAMREGRWQTTVGRDLKGRTMGLIGLGRLGSQMAKYAAAFGMPVIAWSQNLTAETATAAGARRVEKAELFRQADIISIHTKLSPRTTGLVGAMELALMKPDALLINTSRGPVIDEAALLTALHEGRIGGAGIDVYEPEPLPANHPLRTAPRTLLTPHIGYVTEETYRIFYSGTVAAIQAWLNNNPIHVLPA